MVGVRRLTKVASGTRLPRAKSNFVAFGVCCAGDPETTADWAEARAAGVDFADDICVDDCSGTSKGLFISSGVLLSKNSTIVIVVASADDTVSESVCCARWTGDSLKIIMYAAMCSSTTSPAAIARKRIGRGNSVTRLHR